MPYVFGYGSLTWRPSYPYVARYTGYITGYLRRFWQGSTDHRGVPDAPGRVVTCLPMSAYRTHIGDEKTWGVAYEISDTDWEDVVGHLDHREKGGYDRTTVRVHVPDSHNPGQEMVLDDVLMYYATPDNPEYLGPAPDQEIAQQIFSCVGPSGPNKEYLYGLATWLRDNGLQDDHVFTLEALVRAHEVQDASN